MNGATGWVHIPIKVMHPWNTPVILGREYTVVFQQVGDPETLIHSAIKAGSFLTVNQLKHIQAHLRFKMCEPGNGRGKDGRIIKRDYCEGLIDHLFPKASASERLEMLRGLLGQRWVHLNPKTASKHTKDIIDAFQGLPAEDLSEFVNLAAVASDEILLKEKRDQKTRVEALPKSTKKHETPITLRDLRPNIAGCRLTRHPSLKRYQGFYVEVDSTGSSPIDSMFVLHICYCFPPGLLTMKSVLLCLYYLFLSCTAYGA